MQSPRSAHSVHSGNKSIVVTDATIPEDPTNERMETMNELIRMATFIVHNREGCNRVLMIEQEVEKYDVEEKSGVGCVMWECAVSYIPYRRTCYSSTPRVRVDRAVLSF